jgi:capsular exopolysaccharide synthesis family protein
MDQENILQESKRAIDIRNEIIKYLPFWFWFVGFTILTLLVANFYLRYTPPTYETSAKIKILDNSGSPFKMSSDGIFIVGKSKSKLDNDLEIIKSDRILEVVAKDLNMSTTYYLPGRVIDTELWKNSPIEIEWLSTEKTQSELTAKLTVSFTKKGFKIEEISNKELFFNKTYFLGKIPFRIKAKQILTGYVDKKIIIKKLKISNIVGQLTGSIQAGTLTNDSDVVKLSIKGYNRDKSKDIINCLIKVYNEDGIKDRQLAFKNTIEFVNNRFQLLVNELDSIENYKVSYKKNNHLISLAEYGGVKSSRKSDYEDKIFEIENQIELSNFLGKSINTNTNYTSLPTNLGVLNVNINGFVEVYNQLILERDKILLSAGNNNPALVSQNKRILESEKNIINSIKLYKEELNASLKNIKGVQSQNTELYSSVPEKEKILRSIERQQNIKESLYLLLLQKREEAGINMAITQPSVKVLEFASSNDNPIAPKRNSIYFIALLIGIGIPLVLLFIRFYFDNKIQTKYDVVNISKNIPIIGEIPFILNDKIIQQNDRSILAESYRAIRTNLNFVLPNKINNEAQVIFSTSSIKGEGKTFNAINMALIISQMKKKVIIIGADLRNPQLHKYIGLGKEKIGLTNYLYDSKTKTNEIIIKNILENEYLDVIISGVIPPNPAELISNGRFEELISEIKKNYDYIIVDSSPTLLVTDTLLITHLADLVVYVTRSDMTEKHVVEYSRDLHAQGKIKNMSYIVNSLGLINVYGYKYKYNYSYGYGYNYNYGYGYGYSAEDKEGNNYSEMSTLEKIASKIKEYF